MKLKSTRLEYRFEDASGYGFDVVATLEGPKKGWTAAVSFDAHGYVTAEDAVQHLRHAAEAFSRQLKEQDR